MKKNNYLMLLALVLLLFNCRTELETTHQSDESNHSERIHQKINSNDFKKETQLQSISDFSQVNLLLKNNKADSDFLRRFRISESSIYKMDVNNVETYSLRAYNIFESADNVYNLVYRKKDDKTEFSIVKILSDEIIPVYDSEKGILTKVSSHSTSKTCTDFYSVEIWHCKEGVSWSQCDKCDQCLYYSSGYTSYECGGAGGGTGGGGGSNPGGNTDPGGGGGGTGVYDPSGYTFDPNIPPTFDKDYIRAVRASAFFNQLDYGTQVWAGQYPEAYCAVLEYYLDQLPTLAAPQNTNALILANWAVQFLVQNPDTLEPENLISRAKALDNALIQNPNLLLKIPCEELDDWQAVATHQIPQSVKTKLGNIKNQTSWWSNWQITDLDDGASARINMDLFSIKINTLPNKPNSNQKYTPAEFFNFFRLNLNLFAEKFTPIVDTYYGINDTALWNSSNPLGSLIHIEIPLDDGTVICSGVNNNTWIFSTIKAPMGMAYDGIHPVAGNRVFSFHMEGNTMFIYTRGVDRVSKNATSSPNLANYLIETAAFTGADQLWSGMQEKLSKFVNDHGGSATKEPEKTYRPDYTKVKNYLKGNVLLSSLGCS